jgi:hypothetical protein
MLKDKHNVMSTHTYAHTCIHTGNTIVTPGSIRFSVCVCVCVCVCACAHVEWSWDL